VSTAPVGGFLLAAPAPTRVSLRSDPLQRRWLAWAALVTAYLLMNLHRLSSAVLADRLVVAFDTTAAQLGTLHAAFFYIYAGMQLPAGVLADRYGPRLVMTVGTLTLGLGAAGFALSESYLLAFASRALIGLGGGVTFVATLRFLAAWFRPDEFATMNGLTVAASGIGGILATTPLAVAASTVGWRVAILGLGVVAVAVAGVIYVVARDSPSAAGLEPIEGVEDHPTLTLPEVGANVRLVLAELETWLLAVAMFCTTGAFITLLGLWGVPYLVQVYGLSVTGASWYTLLGSVGLLVGSPAFGRLSDTLGRRIAPMLAGVVAFAAIFLVIPVLGQPPLAIIAAVYFLAGFLGGAFVLGYPIIQERHHVTASGVATGTLNAAAFAGAAVFPTIMGAILDAYWTGETVAGTRIYTAVGYRMAFATTAVAALLALACVSWFARRVRRP